MESHKWSNLATSRTSAENRERYAKARDLMAELMTPQQLAEAQKRAAEWQAAYEKK